LFVNGPISGYQVKPSGTTQYVNHAQQAKVTVSSTQEPYRVNAITDGEIGIYERLERYEWVSKSEKMGAQITLAWDTPRCVEYVMLYDSAVKSRKIKTGHVILNNDPKQVINNITFPDGPGEAAILRFPEKKEITSLTFVVDQLQDPAEVAGMSEIVVLGYPEGHVWLSSPIADTIQKGIIPLEIQGIHEPVAKAFLNTNQLF
jgi:hypothetical protein